MPEGALTPFTACDAYRDFAGRALLMTSQNIYYQRIVLWCLIHTLTLRRNLISLAIFNAIF